MEETMQNITNDLYELKANIRQIVNKYNIKYLSIDIEEDESIENRKDVTLSIEI